MMKQPKVGIFDIEVLSSMAADCGSVCCMSIKELGKRGVKTMSVEDYPATYKRDVFDDSKLVKDIVKELRSYDVLIGHNSKSSAKWGFDIKYINTRIIMNGLDIPPLQGITEIDTYHDLAKKHLRFRSNKLSEIGKALGAPKDWVDSKEDMQFPRDWNKYIVKAPGANKKMYKRNQVDVLLTEFVYNKLKKMHTNHPNFGYMVGVHKKEFPCPTCGQLDKVNNKDKVRLSGKTRYQRLVCRRCSVTFRGPNLKEA